MIATTGAGRISQIPTCRTGQQTRLQAGHYLRIAMPEAKLHVVLKQRTMQDSVKAAVKSAAKSLGRKRGKVTRTFSLLRTGKNNRYELEGLLVLHHKIVSRLLTLPPGLICANSLMSSHAGKAVHLEILFHGSRPALERRPTTTCYLKQALRAPFVQDPRVQDNRV